MSTTTESAPAVCPRCLDIEPGKPAPGPDGGHPGPFTADLCGACQRVVDAELRAERGALWLEAAEELAKRLLVLLTRTHVDAADLAAEIRARDEQVAAQLAAAPYAAAGYREHVERVIADLRRGGR